MAIVRIKQLHRITVLGMVAQGEATFKGHDVHGNALVCKTVNATLTHDNAEHLLSLGNWSVKTVSMQCDQDVVCEWDASV